MEDRAPVVLTPPQVSARLAARQPNGRRPLLMYHRWEALLFLHWTMPPARLQETLPDGLTVDTYGGDGYLGIVPFFMRNVRSVGLPRLPWISAFQELNVRTYVFDREGVPGVWFYSLDCNQPLAVVAARALTGLPYFVAEMNASRDDFIAYSCRRRGAKHVAQYRYRGVGEPRESALWSLEFFLLERYYFFAQRGRSVVRAQVSHPPYLHRQAEVETWSTVPAEMDGFETNWDSPRHTCYVDGFDVKIYGTEKIRERSISTIN